MATFFGEVMAPVSRAFWNGAEDIDDDDEGDISEPRGPVYKFKEEKPQVENSYSLMIFATDQFCSDYSRAFLMSGEPELITEIEEVDEKSSDEQIKRPQTPVASLFKIKNDVLLLACKRNIPLEYANDLLLMVAPWLDKSKDAAVLASKPVAEFITSNKELEENAFVRVLKTKSYTENIPCKQLEVPNAVSGFPAAMMTWRQIHEQPCVLSVYYYANSLPLINTIDVAPLRKHLQAFQWYQHIENSKTDLTSIPLYNHVFENSNMYL
ncbi:proteasome assembly chaperone 1-like [Nilaparvata lugens]|uniref:proteasome assembly chaperone 1-like n=1 Tax=Nilaparvata lugens TaxID=108931 RepID=UPI000B998B05|nr:proteasome assembly chaperone 1-like [Nilaparvata lugens]